MSFPKKHLRPSSQLIVSAGGPIVSPYGSFLDPAKAILMTLGTTAAGVVHATEFSFPHPRRCNPLAFQPLYAVDTAGVAAPVASWLPLVNRTDNRLGLTVNFAPPQGRVSMKRVATQTLTTAAFSNVQWDTNILTQTGNLSCDTATTTGTPPVNSRIVCAVAGEIHVDGSGLVDNSVTTFKRMFISKNNVNTVRYGYGVNPTGYFGAPSSADIAVAAGDYISLVATQNSVGDVNLLGGDDGATLQARYTAPPAGYSAIVTGILWCA